MLVSTLQPGEKISPQTRKRPLQTNHDDYNYPAHEIISNYSLLQDEIGGEMVKSKKQQQTLRKKSRAHPYL